MTKQTYRDMLETLQAENMNLKKQVRELEQQLKRDVFDERPLDTIISEYKEEKKELSIPITLSGTLSKPASEFMSQYRKYRQLVSEDVKQKEVQIDVPALNALKNRLNQKPA